jgi:hypothetical protein
MIPSTRQLALTTNPYDASRMMVLMADLEGVRGSLSQAHHGAIAVWVEGPNPKGTASAREFVRAVYASWAQHEGKGPPGRSRCEGLRLINSRCVELFSSEVGMDRTGDMKTQMVGILIGTLVGLLAGRVFRAPTSAPITLQPTVCRQVGDTYACQERP